MPPRRAKPFACSLAYLRRLGKDLEKGVDLADLRSTGGVLLSIALYYRQKWETYRLRNNRAQRAYFNRKQAEKGRK